MRRSRTQTLKEVLNDLISEYRIGQRLKEASLINQWNTYTGKAISSRTTRIYIKDSLLHVYISSSVVRNELMMLREALRERLNSEAGEEVIKEVVIH